MRHLVYTNYQSGHSGLSNGIMSIECGVVLAFLTNRLLVLDGNISPPANVVSYGGRVQNDTPSRVTDLIDLPVPWSEPDDVDLGDLPTRELTDEHLGQVVYYAPASLDITSKDALAFARERTSWLTADGLSADIPVLKVTEKPIVLREDRHRNNLSYYSYLFYLDDEVRRSVYRTLQRMQPKAPLTALANRVVGDLGPFNAIHLRRGDFKVTYGVTTLDRQPWEAIESMDHHFSRDDLLVIVTDERDDPFFKEITAAYPQHVFIDHHILDEYGSDFDKLPARDSLALAYLSQLVAADSEDFIGTMTSTFTAIIQRYRGNRGKDEHFKFFWNELPDPQDRVERGRHPVSECVALDQGIMVEEHEGPYSWNRVNQRLAPSWMREWPESFITKQALETGSLAGRATTAATAPWRLSSAAYKTGPSVVHVPFDGVRIAIKPSSGRLALKLAEGFSVRAEPAPSNVIAELEVIIGEQTAVEVNGHPVPCEDSDFEIMKTIKLEMVPLLVTARPGHAWLEATSFERNGKALLVVGDLGSGDDHLPDILCSQGWDLLWDDVVPIHAKSGQVIPFGRSTWPKGASVRTEAQPVELGAIVLSACRLKTRDDMVRLSPSVAVAELIGYSLDFKSDREKAVQRLCGLAESLNIYQLSFSRGHRAGKLLSELVEWDPDYRPDERDPAVEDQTQELDEVRKES